MVVAPLSWPPTRQILVASAAYHMACLAAPSPAVQNRRFDTQMITQNGGVKYDHTTLVHSSAHALFPLSDLFRTRRMGTLTPGRNAYQKRLVTSQLHSCCTPDLLTLAKTPRGATHWTVTFVCVIHPSPCVTAHSHKKQERNVTGQL